MPKVFHGLARVVQDVQEHLLKLIGVHQDGRQSRVELPDDLKVTGAKLILNETQRVFNQIVQAGEFAFGTVFPGKAQEAAHDLVTAPHPVHDAPNIATVLLVQIRVLQQLREPDHCGERVVQLVRDSGDEFPHPSQLFGLDELRLGGPQPFDRLFEFCARSLQVLGHPVERGRQFAKLVAGGRWHAAGKISAPNGFGSAAQHAQRMRHVPHQYPDQTRTQQNAEDAGKGELALVRAQFTPGVFG